MVCGIKWGKGQDIARLSGAARATHYAAAMAFLITTVTKCTAYQFIQGHSVANKIVHISPERTIDNLICWIVFFQLTYSFLTAGSMELWIVSHKVRHDSDTVFSVDTWCRNDILYNAHHAIVGITADIWLAFSDVIPYHFSTDVCIELEHSNALISGTDEQMLP